VDMKLEVVVVPVSDVDKAKDFYQALGWRLDADFAKSEGFRVVQLTPGGVFHHAGTGGRASGPAPNHQSYGSFVSFSDPDGNGWSVQEVTTRLPGR
jgi:catechol 2,3-dioxygenase-like lactoylglutathione lyase family enzyme